MLLNVMNLLFKCSDARLQPENEDSEQVDKPFETLRVSATLQSIEIELYKVWCKTLAYVIVLFS